MNFKFLKIPVKICPTYWIFLLFFTGSYQAFSLESLISAFILTFSLLVHEYGHALTALFFGTRPKITLEAFGGYAQYNTRGITEKQQFLITLNGPLLETLLIALPFSLLELNLFENYYILFFLRTTMHLNILWCLLNLIPISPLDGGYLLRYLLEKRFGEKGYKISIIIGLMSVACIAPYLWTHGLYFFALLLGLFAFQNLQILKKYPSSLRPIHYLNRGIEAINNDDLENAKAILKKLLKTKNKEVKNKAIESLAKIYIHEKTPEKAYDLLLHSDHASLKEGKYLLCQLAYEQKNYALISNYSRDIYEMVPTYETALLNSKAFACLKDPYLAGGWLHTASQFENVSREELKNILKHEIYDAVREQNTFQQSVGKI